MTSLAASPLLPLGTAALAGALIVGTMFGGNSETVKEEPKTETVAAVPVTEPAAEPVAEPAAVPAAAKVLLGGGCAAGPTCIATVPLAGGTATLLGVPVTFGPSTAKAVKVTAPAAATVTPGKVTKVGALSMKIRKVSAKTIQLTVTK